MAERKATNKYYPPEWEPKHGSINKFRGQHPLRERARKLDQGILVVRFEMPYNIWCLSCNQHIGKGVRFNAEKKKQGNYFSTIIWSFRMKCHLCSGIIEIHTDPKSCDFLVVGGAKRKAESWDASAEETGLFSLPTDEEKEKLVSDPFYNLEHKTADIQKGIQALPVLQLLQKRSEQINDSESRLNRTLRDKIRLEKMAEKVLEEEARSKGFGITLLPQSASDLQAASSQSFDPSVALSANSRRGLDRVKIRSRSIFSSKEAIPPNGNKKEEEEQEEVSKIKKEPQTPTRSPSTATTLLAVTANPVSPSQKAFRNGGRGRLIQTALEKKKRFSINPGLFQRHKSDSSDIKVRASSFSAFCPRNPSRSMLPVSLKIVAKGGKPLD